MTAKLFLLFNFVRSPTPFYLWANDQQATALLFFLKGFLFLEFIFHSNDPKANKLFFFSSRPILPFIVAGQDDLKIIHIQSGLRPSFMVGRLRPPSRHLFYSNHSRAYLFYFLLQSHVQSPTGPPYQSALPAPSFGHCSLVRRLGGSSHARLRPRFFFLYYNFFLFQAYPPISPYSRNGVLSLCKEKARKRNPAC